ncbi:MAG: LamG domain-containing protein [Butyrivibrio sp.]|nr:LamG domain-containing protein [Muribaculum sp.]MCM1551235.1 LamG domain-containing protein [Butyrivibrio sp.]
MSVLMRKDKVIRALVKIEGGAGAEAECRKLYSSDQLMLMYDGIENGPYGIHFNNLDGWYDQSQNNRNGSSHNCTWEENGLVFDSAKQSYVTDGQQMNFSTPFTIEAVVNTRGIHSVYHDIVANCESGGYEFGIYNGKYRFYVYIDNGYKEVIGNTVTVGESVYICGKYDGNTISIYQDGLLAAAKDVSGTPKDPTKNSVLMIGANPNGLSPESGYYYTGKIFAVRIYNRALSDDEIADHYAKDYMRFMQ